MKPYSDGKQPLNASLRVQRPFKQYKYLELNRNARCSSASIYHPIYVLEAAVSSKYIFRMHISQIRGGDILSNSMTCQIIDSPAVAESLTNDVQLF